LLPIGEAADLLGVQSWRLRRLFERGLLGEPERVGRTRVVRREQLPRIREALEKAGYLRSPSPELVPA
jgi:DNA-binding transcriptional MerR regulator